MAQFVFVFFTDQMRRVEKNVIWKNICVCVCVCVCACVCVCVCMCFCACMCVFISEVIFKMILYKKQRTQALRYDVIKEQKYKFI